jgi:hypothetical protein
VQQRHAILGTQPRTTAEQKPDNIGIAKLCGVLNRSLSITGFPGSSPV